MANNTEPHEPEKYAKRVISNLDVNDQKECITHNWINYFMINDPCDEIIYHFVGQYEIGIQTIAHPNNDIIKHALECHWTITVYNWVMNHYTIDDDLQRFINKLKISKGPPR